MKEHVFQHIWQENPHLFRTLESTDRQVVEVLRPGTLNHTDGPDFRDAVVLIDGIRWYGSIELHLHDQDWYAHRHHIDPLYNNVVLQIVLHEPCGNATRREDGTIVPTVCVKELLPTNLSHWIKSSYAKNGLQCRDTIHQISENIIETQISIASEQYFNRKKKQLLEFYDPSMIPSRSWLRMFFTAWCDGLGIPHNRENMKELAQISWELPETFSHDGLNEQMEEIVSTLLLPCWNHKGSRPANRPERLVKYAFTLLWNLRNIQFRDILLNDAAYWIDKVSHMGVAGTQRLGILNSTVTLPALSILGDLFGNSDMSERSLQLWRSRPFEAPAFIIKPYITSGFPRSVLKNGNGLVHQYRDHCRQRRCNSCLIFKSAVGC